MFYFRDVHWLCSRWLLCVKWLRFFFS